MHHRSAAFIPLSLVLVAALFLPWTGNLTMAGAVVSSIRYLAIGLTIAWADVVLILVMTAMLLTYPLVSFLMALHGGGTRKRTVLIGLVISLIPLVVLPLVFAMNIMFETLPALSWGYWLYQ